MLLLESLSGVCVYFYVYLFSSTLKLVLDLQTLERDTFWINSSGCNVLRGEAYLIERSPLSGSWNLLK